jgi:hypothetical protein
LDRVSFEIEPEPFTTWTDAGGREHHGGGGARLRILVNSDDLIEAVSSVERASVEKGLDGGPAGGYAPLWLRRFDRGLLYGRPHDPELRFGARIALLGCVCGEVACWPLLVRVAVDAAAVTWSDFEQPYRKGFDYEPLGSLSFSREQYDAAVDDAEHQFAEKVKDPPGWRDDWREAKLTQLRAVDRMLAALAIKHELQDVPSADARNLRYEDPRRFEELVESVRTQMHLTSDQARVLLTSREPVERWVVKLQAQRGRIVDELAEVSEQEDTTAG